MDLQDAVAKGNIPPIGTATNVLFNNSPFQQRLHTTEMPWYTEFVTSGAKDPHPIGIKWFLGRNTLGQDVRVAIHGDRVVPLDSMAGYNSNGTPVFANLSPVDIRGYANNNPAWQTTHGPATEQMKIYPHLLDGVQYLNGLHPDGGTNWNGFQKEFGEFIWDYFVHTDEPGIADLQLLYSRNGKNPLVIWAEVDPILWTTKRRN